MVFAPAGLSRGVAFWPLAATAKAPSDKASMVFAKGDFIAFSFLTNAARIAAKKRATTRQGSTDLGRHAIGLYPILSSAMVDERLGL
jgi:hypothetical protein